jgi:hypothetical protein
MSAPVIPTALAAIGVTEGLIIIGFIGTGCVLWLRDWNASTRKGEKVRLVLLGSLVGAALLLLMLHENAV